MSRRGVRRSKVLPTKREAIDWGARVEAEIMAGSTGAASPQPLSEVLTRYAREVSPTKRGERWESLRLNNFAKSDLGRIRMRDLGPEDIARWRDARLAVVSPGTVRRELNLLSAVLTKAVKEWRLIASNPCEDVTKPTPPPARDRLVTDDEIERLVHVAGDDLGNATARAIHAFRLACVTGMRAGEIVGLRWAAVDLDSRVARLARTKNGTAREVPLSLAAVDLLRPLAGRDPIFGLHSRQLDALFRKVREKAAIEGLTFHDSRHRAITDLSQKLDVLALAKMVGHRNIRQLLTYYDASASDLARRLD
ncbi:tyrosine-type recombinase/integrase [Paracoccus sp. p3-h83]|uniref:tyrosine-type recombinase/integrase n=1 Tax=Paracoccus sp. p3-h83 TaxID=3342805 RepID=UPI0035B98D78